LLHPFQVPAVPGPRIFRQRETRRRARPLDRRTSRNPQRPSHQRARLVHRGLAGNTDGRRAVDRRRPLRGSERHRPPAGARRCRVAAGEVHGLRPAGASRDLCRARRRHAGAARCAAVAGGHRPVSRGGCTGTRGRGGFPRETVQRQSRARVDALDKPGDSCIVASGGAQYDAMSSPSFIKRGAPVSLSITLPEHAVTALIEPHGGELKNLYLDDDAAAIEKERARDWRSWNLTPRQLCDIELLLNGAFSPREGFLGQAAYESACRDLRLADGTLWSMPVTLDVSREFAAGVQPGDHIALRDPEGVLIATMEISDLWEPDLRAEALAVFGSDDVKHPSVDFLLHRSNPVYLGGRLRGVEAPTHYDFGHLRDTPAGLRAKFQAKGWQRVVAFRPATPCTARTRSSPSVPRSRPRRTCSSSRWWA